LQLGVEPKRISDAALVWLGTFAFPGNVRQLENICHWLTVMAPAQVIEPKDLPHEVGVTSGGSAAPLAPVASDAVSPQQGTSESAPALFPAATVQSAASSAPPLQPVGAGNWEQRLEAEAVALLATGRTDVWDELTRRFESRLIVAALASTRGRRIEAAQKLGIGRNTITRKIQELGLE
jgi:two-component system nitrogen regulation response regulator GlnG